MNERSTTPPAVRYLEEDLRRVRRNIKTNLQAGGLAEASYERDRKRELECVRAIAGYKGRDGFKVLLGCGHDRFISFGSYEEAEMDRTGTVECRGRTPRGEVRLFCDRGDYVAILGWNDV